MTSGIWQMRPLSRGYVEGPAHLDRRISRRSTRRYMDDERDRRAVIGGMRLVRQWFAAPALARYVVAETVPGADVQTDDEFLAYARETGTTVFHRDPAPCRMGPDVMVRGRRSVARARVGGAARHRCLHHAGGDLHQ